MILTEIVQGMMEDVVGDLTEGTIPMREIGPGQWLLRANMILTEIVKGVMEDVAMGEMEAVLKGVVKGATKRMKKDAVKGVVESVVKDAMKSMVEAEIASDVVIESQCYAMGILD